MAIPSEHQPDSQESPAEQRGTLERAIGSALELLAQKEQELAEARRSEDRYRSLVEKVMDFVFCIDTTGRFTFVNSASLLILGYRPEELIGQQFLSILSEESRPVALDHFRRNLGGHGPRTVYELDMLTKDERRLPVEVHGTNVYEGGEVVGIRGIARDISARRRSEDRQKHLFNELRAINRVGQQIASVLDLDELLPFLVELVRQELGYHNVNVFLTEDAGEYTLLKAAASSYGPPLPPDTALKIGEQGIVGWVAKTGQSMLVGDVSTEPRYYATRELHQTRSELTVPVKLGDQVMGVLDFESERLNDFDEGDLWAAQTLADQIAVAIRNAELFESERRGRQETAIILETTRAVNSTLLLDEVLQVTAGSMARAVGVSDCGLYLMDETGTTLLPRKATDGPLARHVGESYMSTTLDVASSRFLSQVVRSKRPTICANAETDPRMSREIVKKFHLKSLLAVPFVSRERVLGMAMLTSYRRLYSFSPEQVDLAAGIASSVALAIDNARLYEKTHDLAVMEERNRLAREIHDTIAQSLTGIVLQLEAADHLLGTNLDRARTRVQKATELARSSLQEARRSVWNLRPAPLEERTLIEAIRQEADRSGEEGSFTATVEVDGDPSVVSGETENGLYRMVQEALSNVRKHARASRVDIHLRFRDGWAELLIRDDGAGFEPSARREPGKDGGFGLLGLRERARLLGGSLRIESAPGCGTSVEVRVPVSR